MTIRYAIDWKRWTKMKIGIITVFYTENCGSVLQATALSEKLEELGHEVFFVSTKNKLSGHSFKRLARNCAKAVKGGNGFWDAVDKFLKYDRYIKSHFKMIPVTALDMLDRIVIGSDTVWDIMSEYFQESREIFWMEGTSQLPIITYAASAANSSYEKLDELMYPQKAIESYQAVSVRDQYTYDYVRRSTSKIPMIVCDPTLLQDKMYYVEKSNKIDSERYLLLYLFDEPNKDVQFQIKDFVAKHDLKIKALVCLGKRISFADEWIESTIENFLSYFNQADFIVTNTFHGTVFSVIFNKQFVVLDYQKVKINEFLYQTMLQNRLVDCFTEKKMMEKIDYKSVNEILLRLREAGEKFLKENVGSDEFGE